jgi:hypothetical protein
VLSEQLQLLRELLPEYVSAWWREPGGDDRAGDQDDE